MKKLILLLLPLLFAACANPDLTSTEAMDELDLELMKMSSGTEESIDGENSEATDQDASENVAAGPAKRFAHRVRHMIIRYHVRQAILDLTDVNEDGEADVDEIKTAVKAARTCRYDIRKNWFDQYDVDASGDLSEDEKIALIEARLAVRKDVKSNYDTDGDGVLSQDERKVLGTAILSGIGSELLGKYDANDDGKISAEEVADEENQNVCSPIYVLL